jgi:hypothetical protein
MKEEVVDYETVERTREITRCDHCERSESEIDDASLVPLLVGPTISDQTQHYLEVTGQQIGRYTLPEYISHFGTIDVCTECFDELYETELELMTAIDPTQLDRFDRKRFRQADDVASIEFPDWERSTIPRNPTVRLSETETEIKHRFGNRRVLAIGLVVGASLGSSLMVAASNLPTRPILYPIALIVIGVMVGLLFNSVRNFEYNE